MEIWSESDARRSHDSAHEELAALDRQVGAPALPREQCREIAAHWAKVWGDTLRDDAAHRRRFRGLVSLAATRENLGFVRAESTEHLASMLGAKLHEEDVPSELLRNDLTTWNGRRLLRTYKRASRSVPVTFLEFPSLTHLLLSFARTRAVVEQDEQPYPERLMPLMRVCIEHNVELPSIEHWQEIEGERRRTERLPTVDERSIPSTPQRRSGQPPTD